MDTAEGGYDQDGTGTINRTTTNKTTISKTTINKTWCGRDAG
ncbi:MAG: hypothetical protein ABI076_11290 [Acidobacteriaceae bacterium]